MDISTLMHETEDNRENTVDMIYTKFEGNL